MKFMYTVGVAGQPKITQKFLNLNIVKVKNTCDILWTPRHLADVLINELLVLGKTGFYRVSVVVNCLTKMDVCISHDFESPRLATI